MEMFDTVYLIEENKPKSFMIKGIRKETLANAGDINHGKVLPEKKYYLINNKWLKYIEFYPTKEDIIKELS